MMLKLDEDGSGQIEFAEFLKMLKLFEVDKDDYDQVSLDSDEEDQVRRQTFAMFDKDGGGSIDLDELADVFKQMGREANM